MEGFGAVGGAVLHGSAFGLGYFGSHISALVDLLDGKSWHQCCWTAFYNIDRLLY